MLAEVNEYDISNYIIIKDQGQLNRMEYINVSQFYESVLCFAIPLLLIQRIILFVSDLSSKYEDYRRTFYED